MTNIQFQPPTPTIQFEVKLENTGHMHVTSLVPGDEATANLVAQALMQTQPFGPGWDAEYRSLYLLSGAMAGPVSRAEDLQVIPVPHWRRLRGTIRGQELSLSERSTSTDGEHWQPYPEADPNAEAQHPVFNVSGAVKERYTTLQWREGRIDIDPEPEGDLLEVIEQVVQMFNGLGDTEWKARHEQFGGDPKVVPDAKRTGFEVRQLAPVLSGEQQPFIRVGDLEFWPLVPLEYSRDGKKWERYSITDNGEPLPILDAADDESAGSDPFEMLSQMFDIQSAAVTVHADGQLHWDEAEIPEAHREALRASILGATGAGNAAAWAAQTGVLNPGGAAPQAVRLQVMKALLDAAPGMLDQSYAPVAYTTDGVTWQDIKPQFDEDEEEMGV